MNTSPAAPSASSRRERALVLGGGGSAGNAWLIGVVAGLGDAGLDVTDADLIVGTSAGATAAAQLTGANPAELLDAVLSFTPPPGRAGAPTHTARQVSDQMERTGRIFAASENPADMRRRLGAAALELDPDGAAAARWRAIVAPRLPGPAWPDQLIRLTAIDARSGEPVVFDRHSGVDLVDAVAASTSSGAPYRIGDGRYLDGGYRRGENADLAAGYERVLVLSPLGGRTRTPLHWGLHLQAQVDELRGRGSRVETILPDDRALAAFGDTLMDPASRPPSARAGFEHGRHLARQLSRFWR